MKIEASLTYDPMSVHAHPQQRVMHDLHQRCFVDLWRQVAPHLLCKRVLLNHHASVTEEYGYFRLKVIRHEVEIEPLTNLTRTIGLRCAERLANAQ
jgi:hypothetical protein